MKFASALAATVVISASAFAEAPKIYSIPLKDIDGKETSLKAFEGKVILAVNVASKCGLTPQYEGLQELYSKNKDKGLVVVGFPCNDFGKQEPGTEAEVKEFCSTKFSVTFPMMSKLSVKGPEQHPLYKELTGPGAAFPGDVKWNFGKFLIGKDGKPLQRFEPRTPPNAPAVVAAIEKAIAAK